MIFILLTFFVLFLGVEVEARSCRLSSCSTFIVVHRKDLFVWYGSASSDLEKTFADNYVEKVAIIVLFVCFVLFCFVLFCFVLFCFVLFCFVLFCFVLLCYVMFCFVLFYFIYFQNLIH